MFSKIKNGRKFWTVLALALVMGLILSGCGDSSGSADSSGEEEADEGEITFESLSVVDNDYCSIEITGINEKNYTLDVELTNKTSDTTYMFAVYSASINGVEVETSLAETVSAGNSSIDEIEYYDDDLEEAGIDVYTDIELSFHVYNNDDWEEDDVADVTVHVYPYGEENATVYERETLETDNVIIDNDYVTVIVTGYGESDIWGYAMYLYLVNKTDTTVMFSIDEAAVNGYMCDPFWANEVPAGKSSFSSVYWYDSDLEELGITDYSEIETLEFLFTAYDSDNFDTEDYVSETITLNPEMSE